MRYANLESTETVDSFTVTPEAKSACVAENTLFFPS